MFQSLQPLFVPFAFLNLGPWEIGLIVFLALLFFGGKRLPSMAKDLGSGIKEFRKSLMGESDVAEPSPPPYTPEPKASEEPTSPKKKKKQA